MGRKNFVGKKDESMDDEKDKELELELLTFVEELSRKFPSSSLKGFSNGLQQVSLRFDLISAICWWIQTSSQSSYFQFN